eukprot:scaffold1278_cov191-Cylindrotheca_fusiformis.AAC.3
MDLDREQHHKQRRTIGLAQFIWLEHRNLKANMGQGASKRIRKSAEAVANKAADYKSPSPRTPPPQSKTRSAQAPPDNPGGFLRGSGMAGQDIRDVSQEMYLKSRQKDAPQDMPDDLLKFIQDVGPARQSIDEKMTAKRLLEKENVGELEKKESERKVPRKRMDMPLMGEDYDFSVTRNTNFTNSAQEVDRDFGVSNMEFYELVRQKGTTGIDKDSVVEQFYKKLVSADDKWSEEEEEAHKKKLVEAMDAVQIPVLRIDPDGNILGLHPDRVPGAEVKSLQSIPPSKAVLVLEDVFHRPLPTIKRRRPEKNSSEN